MDSANGKRFLGLLCCLWVLGLGGCAEFGQVPSWVPFQDEADDDLAGVPSPYERIEGLRKLAGEAARTDAEKRQQILAELARSFPAEEDPLIRAEMVRTLGEYPGAEADAVLRGALSDPEPDVRIVACEAWGKRGDAGAAKMLSGVLGGDVDQDVRLAAARALGNSKDPAAVAAWARPSKTRIRPCNTGPSCRCARSPGRTSATT